MSENLLCSYWNRGVGIIEFNKDGTYRVFDENSRVSKKEKKFDNLGEKSKLILKIIKES